MCDCFWLCNASAWETGLSNDVETAVWVCDCTYSQQEYSNSCASYPNGSCWTMAINRGLGKRINLRHAQNVLCLYEVFQLVVFFACVKYYSPWPASVPSGLLGLVSSFGFTAILNLLSKNSLSLEVMTAKQCYFLHYHFWLSGANRSL